MAVKKKIEAKKIKETGRPSLYRPEYDKRIVEVMREGASVVEFCAEIGVVKDTIYEWAHVHPSFSDAFTRARMLCQAWWEKQGRINLSDEYSDGAGRKFNDRLWNRNMACRFQADWTETKRIDLSADLQKDKSLLEKLLEK